MSGVHDLLSPFGNATVSRRSLLVGRLGVGICGLFTLHIFRSSRRKGASSDPPFFYAALLSVQSVVSVEVLEKLLMQH